MRSRRSLLRLAAAGMAAASLFWLLMRGSWMASADQIAGMPAPQTDALPMVETGVRQLSAGDQGVSFTLVSAGLAVGPRGAVTAAGLEQRLEQPGAPSLPYFSRYIALPPQAELSVVVQEGKATELEVGQLKPAPYPTIAGDAAPLGGANDSPPLATRLSGQDSQPDPDIYLSDQWYPVSAYWLSAPQYVRDLRVVELRLYPVRYQPNSGLLHHAAEMAVSLSFSGADFSAMQPAGGDGSGTQLIEPLLLNPAQASQWRSLPAGLDPVFQSPLPVGQEAFRIAVSQDGIYEVSGAELAAAGMAIGSVNPETLEMMYRGEPVAYQFLGDSDTVLEPDERVRFYGWAFDGPRSEKQFVSENAYWLWAGGSRTEMTTRTNQLSAGYPVTTSFASSITREPENMFFATWNLWDGFPNEPDSFYWDYINQQATAPISRTYTMTLPYPEPGGPDATYLVEISGRREVLVPSPPHDVDAYLQGYPTFGSGVWYGRGNVNITNTIPISALRHGTNWFNMKVNTRFGTSFWDQLYLNRITVDYQRQLMAEGDWLQFHDTEGGGRQFQVGGFSQPDAQNYLAWDISNPRLPVQVEMGPAAVTGSGGVYTATIAGDQPAGSRYLVSSAANIRSADAVSRYLAPSLDPVSGGADWLVITHPDFRGQAEQLAAHRGSASFGGLATHVVEIQDVISQYGHGLPLPAAIRGYLSHALAAYDPAPRYVLLMGDATFNPRNLDCLAGCSGWDKDEPTYVLTDIVFEDRFQGLIPSDHTFVTLSGGDLLPDMAIGRISAGSAAEAQAAVDKIVLYEELARGKAAWQREILFVADDADDAGNFCAANDATGGSIPAQFNQTHLCLPDNSITATAVLTGMMDTLINDTGASILNYRGHGNIEYWASPAILSSKEPAFWQNPGRPLFILSADCHDGNFAWPGRLGLADAFLTLAQAGSAGQWSSTGMGYTGEHTVLHRGFYEGMFQKGMSAVGDAASYSKARYASRGYHESELYSFVLLGDPAMQLYRPDLSMSKEAVQSEVFPEALVDYRLTLTNQGYYPSLATVTDPMPAGMRFVSARASLPIAVSVVSDVVTIRALTPIGWGETAVVTVTAQVETDYVGTVVNRAYVTNSGQNISSSGPIEASAAVTITDAPIIGLTAANDSPSLVDTATNFSAQKVSGSNVSYQWSFGDGSFGSGQTVSHTYTAAGNYTALVTATNPATTVSASTVVTVVETVIPIAGLVAANDSPSLLGTVTTLYAAVSQGSNVQYAWSFGDGATGSGAVITHTYAATGSFTAVVTATNLANTATASSQVLISDQPIAITGLQATSSSPTVLGGFTLLEAQIESGSNVAYRWSMSDGGSGSGKLLLHRFPAPGIYTATVTAENELNSAAASTSIEVLWPYSSFLPVVLAR